MLELADPRPGLPGPFALEDAERLAGLLSPAGLSDVSVGEVPTPLRAASFDATGTSAMVSQVPPDRRGALGLRSRRDFGPTMRGRRLHTAAARRASSRSGVTESRVSALAPADASPGRALTGPSPVPAAAQRFRHGSAREGEG